VDVDLGIQAVQVAFFGDHQGVDLQQSQIVVLEQFSQAQEDLGELLDLVTFQTQLECQIARLERLRTNQRIDGGFQNLLGSFLGNLFNFHTAFGRGHEDHAASGTIDHGTQIEFLVDIDRKSTRLNSSHVKISYAVFCLKKKKITKML